MNKNIMNNENKGFSLVELIVVIAIMAVLTSVLAPALLQYVEKSRAQKDDSAMGEVTNAIKIALADQDVFDECLQYNVENNFAHYLDAADEVQRAVDNKTLDGTKLKYGMRGMTITFYGATATNDTTFSIDAAKINSIKAASTDQRDTLKPKYKTAGAEVSTVGEMTSGDTKHHLSSALKAAVGSEIKISSQTYRNSEYTVFVKMSTLNGTDPGIEVYGEWNGTNL